VKTPETLNNIHSQDLKLEALIACNNIHLQDHMQDPCKTSKTLARPQRVLHVVLQVYVVASDEGFEFEVLQETLNDIHSQDLKLEALIAHPPHLTLCSEPRASNPDARAGPISYMRIQQPARGRQCRHVQCFDLVMFLEFAHRHASWLCPCCNKPLNPKEIHVDALFAEVSGGGVGRRGVWGEDGEERWREGREGGSKEILYTVM
jgi:hypothetical protein